MGCTLFQPINNLYQSVISCLLWWAYFVLSSSFAWLFSCCFSSSCSCPCCCRFRPGFSLFRGPAILFFGFFVFVSGRIVFGVVGIVGVSAVTCFWPVCVRFHKGSLVFLVSARIMAFMRGLSLPVFPAARLYAWSSNTP